MYPEYQRAHAWTTDPETFPVGTVPGSGRDIRDAFLAIETRLRTFSDVPLRASRIDAPLLTPATFERFQEEL